MEDRFSAFLSKTTDDLGVQLENLKLLFDMKQEVFHKTAIKGVAAENDILEFLEAYIERFHLGDVVSLSATTSLLKTDDIHPPKTVIYPFTFPALYPNGGAKLVIFFIILTEVRFSLINQRNR